MVKFVLGAAACLLATACARQPGNAPASQESWRTAIRDLGFECDDVTSFQGAGDHAWRVACSGSNTYAAFTTDAGDFCVEPVFVGEGPGPAVASLILPPPRCRSQL
jgi:hypothetical protein